MHAPNSRQLPSVVILSVLHTHVPVEAFYKYFYHYQKFVVDQGPLASLNARGGATDFRNMPSLTERLW